MLNLCLSWQILGVDVLPNCKGKYYYLYRKVGVNFLRSRPTCDWCAKNLFQNTLPTCAWRLGAWRGQQSETLRLNRCVFRTGKAVRSARTDSTFEHWTRHCRNFKPISLCHYCSIFKRRRFNWLQQNETNCKFFAMPSWKHTCQNKKSKNMFGVRNLRWENQDKCCGIWCLTH